tara:strand:+ start:1876 stop:2289 length:414 start_codon:yes stop_codon:yes gene_type:complete
MENPTAILTLGLGALVAVAGYLGWSNLKPETPRIIDTDVHSFDSSQSKENETTENVVLSKENVSENTEEKINEPEPENLYNEVDSPVELKKLKEETKEEIIKQASEQATISNTISNTWGQFWKGEYDNMNQKVLEEH